MSAIPTEAVRGADLIATWHRGLHSETRGTCLGCGGDCLRDAVIRLAYVYDECDCGDPDYVHIVEQLWHRRCLYATAVDAPISWRGRDYVTHHTTIADALRFSISAEQPDNPDEPSRAALRAIGESHDHAPETQHCRDGCPAYMPGAPCLRYGCGARHRVRAL